MEKTYTELIQKENTNKIGSLNPKTKLLVLCLFSICVIVCNTYKFTVLKTELSLLYIPWLIVLFILFAISGQFNRCVKAYEKLLVLAAVVFFVQTFIVPGGEVIFKWHFIDIYSDGFKNGFQLTMSILVFAGIFIWLFNTTENKELAQALEDAGVNYKVSYVFVSTFKMIDVLNKNSKTIMNAQKARGVETEGNLIVRAKAFVPSIVPLVLSAVTGAEERVLTLEARGFNVEGKKTRLFKVKDSGFEKQFTIIWILITVAVIAWRILVWVL